ncbi:DNA-directed RNA polymerase subunit beta', partial [bacterium]|nr:DNA-directed RNA polymerase subunit beta' [bacterium]
GLPKNCLLITTIGKIIFNEIMPKAMPYINHIDLLPPSLDNGDIVKTDCDFIEVIKKYKPGIPFIKKTLQKIVDFLYEKFPIEIVAKTMDLIKNIGFEYSTKSAVSFSAFDLPIYAKKYDFFKEADEKVITLKKQFDKGLLTDDERYTKVIKL